MGSSNPFSVSVVGNIGMPDRAQKDRVAGLQQVERSGRHHFAPAEIMFGAPFEILETRR